MHPLVYRAVLRLRFEISRVTREVIGPELVLTAVGGKNMPRERDAIDGLRSGRCKRGEREKREAA